MPPLRWRLLHLLVLATLAITQPLLSTLGENPTFFIAHSASPGQMVAFTAIVSLAPAAVLGTLMLAGHAVSAEAGERVFYASMAVLAFVFVLQVVDAIPGPAVAVVAVAAVVGYGLMVLYSARGPVRSTVSLLAVFPVAVVALFLFHSPASSIVFPADVEAVALDDLLGADFAAEHLAADGPTPASSAPSNPGPTSSASASSAPTSTASASSAPASSTSARAAAGNTAPASSEPTSPAPDSDAAVRPAPMVERLNDRFPPIYILVLDELPWASLLDMNGRIDAVRYPNFARLGATSHVFTNATTVAFTTEEAVPALLSGTLQAQPAPVFSLYPNNLFTLLGGVYDVSSSDPLVDLCPPAVCNGSPPEQILELIAADEATRSTQRAASSAAPTTTATATATATATTTATAPQPHGDGDGHNHGDGDGDGHNHYCGRGRIHRRGWHLNHLAGSRAGRRRDEKRPRRLAVAVAEGRRDRVRASRVARGRGLRAPIHRCHLGQLRTSDDCPVRRRGRSGARPRNGTRVLRSHNHHRDNRPHNHHRHSHRSHNHRDDRPHSLHRHSRGANRPDNHHRRSHLGRRHDARRRGPRDCAAYRRGSG